MAFTIEEIEKALFSQENRQIAGDMTETTLRRSNNYSVITDFLTGKSNSLAGIQYDNTIYTWRGLISLLENLDINSSRHQLLLNLIFDPSLFNYLQFFFNQWLLHYVFNNKASKDFYTATILYTRQGLNDDDIFQQLVFNSGIGTTRQYYIVNENTSEFDIETFISNSPVEKFLLNHIRQSKRLIVPKQGMLVWNTEWSYFYFSLLEKAGSSHAQEYAILGLQSQGEKPIVWFSTHKDGLYFPAMISYLTNQNNQNLYEAQSKFESALRLYESDKEKFSTLVLQLANQYIEYCKANPRKDKWEHGYHLAEFEQTDLSYLRYSACALHFLFKFEKEKAAQTLQYWQQVRIFVQSQCLYITYHHLKAQAFPYFEAAIKTDASVGGVDYYREVFGFIQKHFEAATYEPVAWSLISNKSKPVRELAAKIVAEKDPAAETKAIELLNNKNAETRQTAAIILSYFPTEKAKLAVMNILNAESSDNARDILLAAIADSLPTTATLEMIADMVEAASKRGKLNKPVETWLNEEELPDLFYAGGTTLSKEEKRFLLYRMSRVKTMRSDMEAKYLLHYLDKEKSAPFALELIKIYKEKGAKPEHKWLMALAALLGNDAVVDKIRTTINDWMDENRYKMAEHGVGAMALQGSDKALRWVEWYSRKYRSKKANVGAAALVALETAADELGISTHELGDRIVPDFGFDGLFKHFTVDDDEYRAFIDSNFKIAFFNEDNKKLKSIPAAAEASLKDEFKGIAKEVRDIVKSQSPRLEYYLIIQRRWSYTQWQKFFMQNPVMFIYATKLVWGVYEGDKLLQTFICNEDTSLVNENGDETDIESDAMIGIVHPTQLADTLLQQWRQYLFDASIEQVFPQLERKVPEMKDIDLEKTIINKFSGKHMVTGSIRSTLERYGWHKGPTGDGGMLVSMNLLYFEKKIETVLEVEGVGAGYGWGMDEKLGRLYIIDKTKAPGRWHSYIQNEEDEKLVKFKYVPSIFLSEMLAAIESIKEQAK